MSFFTSTHNFYLKRFSFKATPALIKRDIKCLFSRKARTEKRAVENRERARLETDPAAQVAALYPVRVPPIRGEAPRTPGSLPSAPSAAPEAQSPQSRSKSTSTTSEPNSPVSSGFVPPSTAITKYSSIESLTATTTYGDAFKVFHGWFSKQHPTSSVPKSERSLFRGTVIVLTIAILECFDEPIYSPEIGFYPEESRVPHSPRALAQTLSLLTNDRQDAQCFAEYLLSIIPNYLGFVQPRYYLERIGTPKISISDEQSAFLHNEFSRMIRNVRKTY